MIDSILDFIARVIGTFIGLLLTIVFIFGAIGLCLGCVVGIAVYLCTGGIFKAILCLLGLCLIVAIMIELGQ